MSKVVTAVIPVAGLGTRFLPITKSVPKELLPVLNRPTLHLICDEILEAGIRKVVLVSNPAKGALEDYVKPQQALKNHLLKAGRDDLLQSWTRTLGRLDFQVVYQREPKGLGHAVLQAKRAVGNRPFALLLPDEIFFQDLGHAGPLRSLVRLHEKENALATVAVKKVPKEDASRYGMVQPAGWLTGRRVFRVAGMVEKPKPEKAPSQYAIIGRYVIGPGVFEWLERTRPARGREIQLTDALDALCSRGTVLATEVEGERFDTGVPLGLVKANLFAAWRDPRYRREIRALLGALERRSKRSGIR